MGVAKYKGSPTSSQNLKFRELVHKLLKIGAEFLATLSILFRPLYIARALNGINVAPHGESK